MFQVPEWGNDIPKSDVEVVKLFSKKNKKKTTRGTSQLKSKDNGQYMKTNHRKKNVNVIKKGKTKMQGHMNLTKDDHINNRILKRNFKKTLADSMTKHSTDAGNTVSKTILKGNQYQNNPNVNSKVKRKVIKKHGKVSKFTSAYKNKVKEFNNNNIKHKNILKDVNNIDKGLATLKRKHALHCKKHGDTEANNADVESLNSDEPDKILVNAKRKKLNDKIKNDDVEDVLFGNNECNEEVQLNKNHTPISKVQKKKEKVKEMLNKDSHRNVIRVNSNKLRERMLERLKAAQFRYLNEKLYTSSGSESQELFKSDPVAFQTYHEGYQLQVKKWPVNPLDLIVKRIQKMPKTHLIADMGCGEAALSKRVAQSVRSFDLVATAPGVEACNMAHTPLLAASVDVVVFCLALMGTDLTQYLVEANRVLKTGGHLLIAEVESRFENVDSFCGEVQRLGFSLKKMDKSHQVFFFMEFSKLRDAPTKRGKLPELSLKPCLYKRR